MDLMEREGVAQEGVGSGCSQSVLYERRIKNKETNRNYHYYHDRGEKATCIMNLNE